MADAHEETGTKIIVGLSLRESVMPADGTIHL
jgi:hypothetical protein